MKFILFSILMLFGVQIILAQGVFSSAGSGDWSAPASWTLDSGSDADGIPDADDDITLLTGHTITLDAGAACNDLTLEGNTGTRLLLGNNTLEINGTLTGLGTSGSSFPNYGEIISNGNDTGGLKFVGGSRALFTNWLGFSNQTQFQLEIALDPGATGTSIHTVKAESILVSSGAFHLNNSFLLVDQGSNGLGDLIINTGAELKCYYTFRSNNITTYYNSILVNGTLEVESPNAYINAVTVTINGTLRVHNRVSSNPTTSNFVYGTNSILEYSSHPQPVAGAEIRRMATGNGSLIQNLVLSSTVSSYNLNFHDLYIGNNLHFNSGVIIGGNQSIYLSPGATITGYSNSRYIITGGLFTPSNDPSAGLFQEVGATPVVFPVGPTAQSYNPVTITNIGDVDNYQVRVDNSVTTAPFPDELVNREWHISEEITGGSDLSLDFQFTNTQTAANFDINTGPYIGHCTGSGGNPPINCNWDNTVASWTGNGTLSNPWVTSASGFMSTSPFSIASGCGLGGQDLDGDGFSTCIGDCDDTDASVNPSAMETCDGTDNNCDGLVDEGFDMDGDGYTSCAGDCDDTDASVNSSAMETCDGIDNNCDGLVDEGFDMDGDGYTSCAGDCDDTDASVNPSAMETCDGTDNNCDGLVDEGFDMDGDGYTSCAGDCDDTDASVNPSAIETCDGIDNNCDGLVDEGFDMDGDGYTSCAGDCDDTDASVNPSAIETCDGIDNNCDGLVDEGFDIDGDGICNDIDNCPDDYNPGQEDEDMDGIGDVCDSPSGNDSDGDGIQDEFDNCPNDSNPGQDDSDCDGVGDVCDLCDGGDDSIDNNEDGLPDCAYPPDYNDIINEWKCGNNKVYICHNGANPNTLCINKNAIDAHMNHGDYLGPCGTASCLRSLDTGGSELEKTEFDESLKVYPNPVTSGATVIIQFKNQGIENPVCEIFNLLGETIERLETGYQSKGTMKWEWKTKDQQPGIYVVVLRIDEQAFVQKVFVAR